MSPKRRKLKKVLDMRGQVLEQCALELAQSREQLKDALDDHSRESARLMVAEKQREDLTAGLIDVGSWIEAEQWLAQKKTDLGRANGRVVAAETTVQHAWYGVVDARIGKKRIELLDGRLATGEILLENRLEQRLTDEFAQRKRKCDER